MTDYRIEGLAFEADAITIWQATDPTHDNWPVVYMISGTSEIYVGETVNAATRLQQHRANPGREHLEQVRIVLNRTFNKSACLDLESHLIRYFAADEKFKVLNGNIGISDADYFERVKYRADFGALFDDLVKRGLLTRPVPELVNSNLFKYSPFKALNGDQSAALSGILDTLLGNLNTNAASELVVQGDPGTGKTIVAIYLVKLLRDIAVRPLGDVIREDSMFAEYFTEQFQQHLAGFRIGLVIPQQSLRRTVQKVFSRIPGLDKGMILSPFEVGLDEGRWDLLIVDEAHRLGIRANQASGMKNRQYSEINMRLFGADDLTKTQLDWIRNKSSNQILLIDSAQRVKPADLSKEILDEIVATARKQEQFFRLTSQMRVGGGDDYIEFVNRLLSDDPVQAEAFGTYDVRFFDSFSDMRAEIARKNAGHGLARLLAGYAWEWVSRRDKTVHDIEIEGHQLFWNRTDVDWVNSATSADEVGSIHTIQGYDLNYAGVVIGRDLTFDVDAQRIVFDRENYFDAKGVENNRMLGISFSDEDIRQFVLNIYRVLLTRGIKGTYVYVVDDALRAHLRPFFD
jgi:DUF2075 family protein/predicted GIY-YIG superfamily endonuclease